MFRITFGTFALLKNRRLDSTLSKSLKSLVCNEDRKLSIKLVYIYYSKIIANSQYPTFNIKKLLQDFAPCSHYFNPEATVCNTNSIQSIKCTLTIDSIDSCPGAGFETIQFLSELPLREYYLARNF